jgi:Flp pilus assembly protein TadD
MAALLKPSETSVWVQYAEVSKHNGDYRANLEAFRNLAGILPEAPDALNNLAWALASGPSELRNGAEAVQLAQKAADLTRYEEPQILGTLAAAYAAAGQFDQAVQTAEQAKALAAEAGRSDVVATNRELLELYRQSKPVPFALDQQGAQKSEQPDQQHQDKPGK